MPFAALEIHCTAPVDVLVARYVARSVSRHAGHLDAQRVDEITQAIAENRNGPLDLGLDTVVLDTTDPSAAATEPVVAAVRHHLARYGQDGGRVS